MPDDSRPYPKQRIEDAIHRGLADPKASKLRQQVRMGDHPYTSEEDRINQDRRDREYERVASLPGPTTRKATRRTTRS